MADELRLPREDLLGVPGFTVVPTASGVEIHVRHITRAPERHEARRRLYREVVALLHGKHDQGADA